MSPRHRFPHASRLAVALVTLVGLLVLGLASVTLLDGSVPESTAPSAIAETHKDLADETSTARATRSIATLPTITPPQQTAVLPQTVPRAGYAAGTRPALDSQRSTTSLPTVAPLSGPGSSRTGCEPAYPEERTCIPPGRPLDQPCAITDERNFTVLPPDPRGLDADGDGVGCEPISP
jgi:hypothetical protein